MIAVMPEVRNFAELFDVDQTGGRILTEDGEVNDPPKRDVFVRFGDHIAIRPQHGVKLKDDFQTLNVRFGDKLVEYYRKHMIFVDYDSIYCDIFVKENGLGVVYLKYNQILGYRIITDNLDMATVPGFEG